MRTFIASIIGGLVALILFIGILFVGISSIFAELGKEQPLPEKIVLSYDMRTPLTDQAPIDFFSNSGIGHIDVILRMKAAETDDNVAGMYIRMAEADFLPARAEELRQAIKSFQDSGKWVIAYTQDMFAPNMPSKYLAVSAADEIWMQPDTSFLMFGVAGNGQFLGGLFEKLDVEAEIFAAHEYKNAANSYTETGFTEAHKSQLQTWINSIWKTASTKIADDRELAPSSLEQILEVPYTSEDAVETGLVSALYWPEQAEDAILEKAGEGADLVDFLTYKPDWDGEGPTVAIVGGEGAVVTGYVEAFQPNEYTTFKSDYIAEQLLEAGKDDDVDVVVFRVDTGGGSVTASAQIRNAVIRVKEEYNKPVIVSMGTLAASGGYWVSAPATKIVANPTTITGSIGAFLGKFATDGALEKIGVTSDTVHTGNELTTLFDGKPYSPQARQTMQEGLDHMYGRFLQVVSEGRGISIDALDEIARGRVWTGEQAKERGLVDELGSITDAIELAAKEAGMEEGQTPNIVFFPDEQSRQDIIFGEIPFLSASAKLGNHAGAMAKDYHQIRTILNQSEIQSLIAEMQMAQAANGQIQARADLPKFD